MCDTHTQTSIDFTVCVCVCVCSSSFLFFYFPVSNYSFIFQERRAVRKIDEKLLSLRDQKRRLAQETIITFPRHFLCVCVCVAFLHPEPRYSPIVIISLLLLALIIFYMIVYPPFVSRAQVYTVYYVQRGFFF